MQKRSLDSGAARGGTGDRESRDTARSTGERLPVATFATVETADAAQSDSQDRRLLRVTLLTERPEVRRFFEPECAVAAYSFDGMDDALLEPTTQVFVVDAQHQDRSLFVQRLLQRTERAVIVLGPPDSAASAMRYLDLGVTDYVTWRTTRSEQHARIRAGARHTERRRALRPEPDFVAGSVQVYLALHEVWKGDEPVRLTPNEFRLLEALLASANDVVSHRELIARVWGPEYLTARHYLRVYIRQLREKLEDEPHLPRIILTEWGSGYRIRAESSPGNAGLLRSDRA